MNLPAPALKIFILDDNALDREACQRYLSRNSTQKYEFFESNSVEGALKRVEDVVPDCILLDYHLQDGNGIEFLNQLEKVGGPKRFPVVMLTGTGSESIAVQVMKAGAQDYVEKGRLNSEVLQRTVETAIYKGRMERLLDEQRIEMERLFREAQEANARKDHFLAALSHELRTPLTPVLAAITSTDVYRTSPEQLHEIFAIIRRNIELEARLIDDMLDITRITRGKLEVNLRMVDIHSLLSHAAHACEEERAAKHIEVSWQLEAANFVTLADPARIQQVFWNILKNAFKFTPQHGRVAIASRNVEHGIELTITDSGIGLHADLQDKIFDAFEQGNSEITRRFGGLGLGLALSKALVDAHEGTIKAANNSSEPGATFTVVLPLRSNGEPLPAEKAFPTKPSEPEPVKGKTILLVEDHMDSAFFIKRMLEMSGYRVLIAENIAMATDVFQKERVDCLVSDLGLPDGHGTDLMKHISALRPVPAVAISGYGMEHDVERSLEAGFARHLTKPVDFQKLETCLQELLV